ncbi:hypothetical protein BHE74_00004416 [Ensete ventricosum]|nr:hypothetical protein GW17_00016880 [Ensete ventricosum]RWW86787.1 hypothetical protein BHE74_00004416 [Ensete ventricosum]RZR90229.1 hypothetical protein BHM03_00018089 [Ensete ventricosum]
MVDVGRHRLEWAAGALDDLQRRGLFSGSKNAGIVRRRCDLDYRLKRLIPADAGHYRLHFVMRGGYTAFATSGSVPSSKRNKPRRRARGSARRTTRSGRSTSPISLGLEDLGWLIGWPWRSARLIWNSGSRTLIIAEEKGMALGIYPSWKQGGVGRLLSDGKEGGDTTVVFFG